MLVPFVTSQGAYFHTWVFLHTLIVSLASEPGDICTLSPLKMLLCFTSSSPLNQPASDRHDGGPWRHPGLPVQPGCQRQPRDSARTRDLCWVHLLKTRGKSRSALWGAREDRGGRTRLSYPAGLQDPQVIHQHPFLHEGCVLKVSHLQNNKQGLG